jgi:hypothetical protein
MTVGENTSENGQVPAEPVPPQSLSSNEVMEDGQLLTSPITSLALSPPKEKPKQRGKYVCFRCGYFFKAWHEQCPNCERPMSIMKWKDYLAHKRQEALYEQSIDLSDQMRFLMALVKDIEDSI